MGNEYVEAFQSYGHRRRGVASTFRWVFNSSYKFWICISQCNPPRNSSFHTSSRLSRNPRFHSLIPGFLQGCFDFSSLKFEFFRLIYEDYLSFFHVVFPSSSTRRPSKRRRQGCEFFVFWYLGRGMSIEFLILLLLQLKCIIYEFLWSKLVQCRWTEQRIFCGYSWIQ